ncbi:MAG: hypothetical protein E4G95_05955 [Bacteroidia bacterium]|nr:MAG: hypothetical protein E4G95_05955 [Bacteroidia bacterium]
MKRSIKSIIGTLLTGLLWGFAIPLLSQTFSFDSLLVANRYEINLEEGRYSGSGLKFLAEKAAESQFFCICEEHNVRELNDLSSFLFNEYHNLYKYNYLVLEQGVAISSLYGATENRGDPAAIADIARRYPQSPTFATDEELGLIATVGRISTSTINPVWGVDQDLGALHILERLTELAPDKKAYDKAKSLADMARRYEMDRINGDTLFLAMKATPELFDELPELFNPKAGSEEAMLIEALERTTRIYYNNYLGRTGQLTLYESSREREHSMKLRFMESYRKAQSSGETLPIVMVKMGHYHLFRGIYRLNVPTFGNFLSEFAVSNGMSSFVISSYVIEGPEEWRNSGGVLAEVAGDAAFTLIDFRPLRAYANQNKIDKLSDGWKSLIFSTDAALIIRGGQTGSYEIVKSAVK